MMNLKGFQNLIKTPDFTTASNLEVLILEGCTKLVDIHLSIGVLKSLKLLNLRDYRSLRTLPTKIGMESLETLIPSGCSSLIRFPEINGKMERLSSLRKLKLRDCNLGEGDIPRDISCLSSLTDLGLSDCKMLKSLPELPSIKEVWIDGCSSLEVVPSPLICNPVYGATVKAISCFKLAENINALTLLEKHLKAFANSRKPFDIVKPGSEIPEWFGQQKSGSSIKIPQPINLRNDSQWIGVACCCIFVDDDASSEIISCNGSILYRNFQQATHKLYRDRSRGGKVKKCGIRIVYEKDLKEIKEL
ncbi:hypothetical protein Goklo_021679, partial [Gossypium klotzschianum]|nr:hypothetical protein [Gossypium klotzschianum]